jgi:hypothetical protein
VLLVIAEIALTGRQNRLKRQVKRHRLKAEEATARSAYADLLGQSVLSAARTRMNDSMRPSYDLRLAVRRWPGLSELYDDAYRIGTTVSEQLEALVAQLPGGTIGLAGPRGAGKSMLIRKYCPDVLTSGRSTRDLAFMISAPVEYAARDFVLHLFSTLCRAYLAYRGEDPEPRGYARIVRGGRFRPPWARREAPEPAARPGLVGKAIRWQRDL